MASTCMERRKSVVERNLIIGLRDVRTAEAGNGISVWNAPGAKVVGNRIRYGRDGIFVITSRRNLFQGNWFEGVRFAVHYMYTNDSEVSGNVSIGSHAALAIMFSDRLVIRGNWSVGSRDHGLLFNFANNARIEDNVVFGRLPEASRKFAGSRWHPDGSGADAEDHVPRDESAAADAETGTGKCVFIYNANRNVFRGNWFEDCAIGIHFTAGSERNQLSGNAFVSSRTQVKYVGTRSLDWSSERAGKLLERQRLVRPERRRHRGRGLPAQRHHRPHRVDLSGRQAAAQQPRHPGHPLGSEAVPGPHSRWCRRYPPPDPASHTAPRYAGTSSVAEPVVPQRGGGLMTDPSIELIEHREALWLAGGGARCRSSTEFG